MWLNALLKFFYRVGHFMLLPSFFFLKFFPVKKNYRLYSMVYQLFSCFILFFLFSVTIFISVYFFFNLLSGTSGKIFIIGPCKKTGYTQSNIYRYTTKKTGNRPYPYPPQNKMFGSYLLSSSFVKTSEKKITAKRIYI
jgi:hypothetical protein